MFCSSFISSGRFVVISPWLLCCFAIARICHGKHLEFVLVSAIYQHLLKSLAPLDLVREVGGSCLGLDHLLYYLQNCFDAMKKVPNVQVQIQAEFDKTTWNVMLLVSLVPSITTTTSKRCLGTRRVNNIFSPSPSSSFSSFSLLSPSLHRQHHHHD